MRNLKHMLWAALLMVSAAVSAQTNPVDGFIITNEGDTIHGTLDYLASRKNSEECHFKKEGESEFLVYKPGEIKGYRFLSDGVIMSQKPSRWMKPQPHSLQSIC